MKITGTDPQTGEQFQIESDKVDESFITSMSSFEMTDEQIKKVINNLNVSADIKSLLYKITTVTLRAGETILKIGRKIIDAICKLLSEFPNATFGMIFGAIAGFLIFSIPFIGHTLGALVTPILIALGLVVGVIEDFKDKTLERKIKEINSQYSPLSS